jgi:hypothetical protein
MRLTITHFAFEGNRWFLRFTGQEEAFQEMRAKLQGQRFALANWQRGYRWSNGKQGAWCVHGLTLRDHLYSFTNLQGTCEYSQDQTSRIYACSYWLEPGKVGYGKYTYYLPR